MFFISPPFGNYINLPYTTSITGSFTLEPREGKWKQIFKTLRYSTRYNGWINKIGLRNPGIQEGLRLMDKEKDIMSIAILQEKEIEKIEKMIPKNLNIELNVSCPNLKKMPINSGLDIFLNPQRKWCIIKLKPTETEESIDTYYNMGFRQFHASNTLPIKFKGGLSGPALIPYTNEIIDTIKNKYDDAVVIAGGGVRSVLDEEQYKKRGANHVSVSSLLFNPFMFGLFYVNHIKNNVKFKVDKYF